MNSELIRQEIEELDRQIKAAADALRILKRKKKLLLNYLDPRVTSTRAASRSAVSSTNQEDVE